LHNGTVKKIVDGPPTLLLCHWG